MSSLPVFRAMCSSDLKEVLQIENEVYSHPWTSGHFLDCFKSGYSSRIALQDGRLAGYSVMMDVLDESHLLNLAVSLTMQGQGVGRMLLDYAVQEARSTGKRLMLLEVRVSNLKAIRLYERAGFYRIHVRRNYYPMMVSGRENALVMGLDL
ncbi:MAG: ribosomal protein S18-alanine N-acetyltransferase [Proteobacteria bacterium]|nr:ribosomal protein S18-alanine N-acetyltransferase [Pseudomonadota bacterium]MDE3208899.1 ribosomal protein S18-alanine N-acetyltransferase [Pseudomonadota bacterium]